jgi:hypothetical protein
VLAGSFRCCRGSVLPSSHLFLYKEILKFEINALRQYCDSWLFLYCKKFKKLWSTSGIRATRSKENNPDPQHCFKAVFTRIYIIFCPPDPYLKFWIRIRKPYLDFFKQSAVMFEKHKFLLLYLKIKWKEFKDAVPNL